MLTCCGGLAAGIHGSARSLLTRNVCWIGVAPAIEGVSWVSGVNSVPALAGSGRQLLPSKSGSASMRQYAGALDVTRNTSMGALRERLSLIETRGSMRTLASFGVVLRSMIAFDPNPGTITGAIAATAIAAAATRRAPYPAVLDSRDRDPGPTHTGPHACTRRKASAKITAMAAARNTKPQNGRTLPSS